MKHKYVMISGLAFSENEDMEKLSRYAAQGWILEGITAGMFYRLKKDQPQNIIYNTDYQEDATEEYFSLFQDAGWKRVVSSGTYTHIFSAKAGTEPIYSDSQSEQWKYESIKNLMKKGSIISSVIGLLLLVLLGVSTIWAKPAFLIILILLCIDLVVFVFNFMPYLAYRYRINHMEKNNVIDEKAINNMFSAKMSLVFGIIYLLYGVWGIVRHSYFMMAFFIPSIIMLWKCISYSRKTNKNKI